MRELISLLSQGPLEKVQISNYFSQDSKIQFTLSDTLSFLCCLEIINYREVEFHISPEINFRFTPKKINELIVKRLILKDIIQVIEVNQTTYMSISNTLFSIRNYLLAEKIIVITDTRGIYRLDIQSNEIITEIKKRIISPEQLENILQKQKDNGLRAEYLALEYESARLYNKKTVQHVSLKNVNLGYDILSYSSHMKSSPDRYIEVKGISEISSKFYLSRNEINMAEHYKDQYFLYIVNLSQESVFVVKNPFKEIISKNIPRIIESVSYDFNDLKG
ncbi:DUF3883 domain-containing protein [Chryseomicrobium palamuruense]